MCLEPGEAGAGKTSGLAGVLIPKSASSSFQKNPSLICYYLTSEINRVLLTGTYNCGERYRKGFEQASCELAK